MKNPYILLDCNKNSTQEEITKNYKKLAMKYHPDRNRNLSDKEKKKNEERFKEITCAYTFLKKK